MAAAEARAHCRAEPQLCWACRATSHGGSSNTAQNALWALSESHPLSHGPSVQIKAGLGLRDGAAAARHFLALQPYSLGIPLLHPVAKDTFLLKD